MIPVGVDLVPVRTPTLPPATHTNTWVVGDGAMTVFDPASPYDDERAHLADVLEERIAAGERVERIVLTHHHHDHVAGAEHLRERLSRRGVRVPIVAHAANVPLLEGRIHIDAHLDDGDTLSCGGRTLRVVFTPGHAPGHLAFQDVDSGAVIAGDMVAGVGTIAIAPEDGHLGTYLASLERLRGLSASVLLPAHGDPLPRAEAVLSFYIAHRHQRTEQIRTALAERGASTATDLVPLVYPELPTPARRLAAAQIRTHLIWLHEHGLAAPCGDDHWEAA